MEKTAFAKQIPSVFVISSPLQLLCDIEAIRVFEISDYKIVVNVRKNVRFEQVRTILNYYGLKYICIRPYLLYSLIYTLFPLFSLCRKLHQKYGRAIVMEDDLNLSKNSLAFMNQGLDKYENSPRVFSICGYTNKVKVPRDYTADAYFCVRSSSWGWGTWADRWNSVDWKLNDWDKYQSLKSAFNRWGGSDCFGMLKGWKEGKNKSWAIRFCFAQFLQDKLSLFPIISKINNNGFDGEGINCKNTVGLSFLMSKATEIFGSQKLRK